jgi:hypothetical protein
MALRTAGLPASVSSSPEPSLELKEAGGDDGAAGKNLIAPCEMDLASWDWRMQLGEDGDDEGRELELFDGMLDYCQGT